MPSRGASPDTLDHKCTPKYIHNKLIIDSKELIRYFDRHTLSECAKKFECSSTTIKRKLRALNIDTSKHNHSEIAKRKSLETNRKCNIGKDDLSNLYIDRNLDTKTISEQFGVHYNTIRKLVHRFGLSKTQKDVSKSMMARHAKMHGYSHPAQRPDVMEKTRRSAQKVLYGLIKMRSLHELSYALYLDHSGVEWHYEEMRIPYVDNMSGKWRIYVIDFTVIDGDNVKWIEVKPNDKMIPTDKRIYASRRAEEAGAEYRGVTNAEREEGFKLLCDGYNKQQIKFLRPKPRSTAKQVSYFFKNNNDLEAFVYPSGWKQHTIVRHSEHLICLKLRRAK